MAGAPLRRCPTCDRSLDGVDVGFRDWAGWLEDTFPGAVSPTDIDWMLERKGHFLVIEFKRKSANIPMGQRITLKRLHKLGMTVWYVKEPGSYGDNLTLTPMNTRHNFSPDDAEEITVPEFRRRLSEWWAEADEEEEA